MRLLNRIKKIPCLLLNNDRTIERPSLEVRDKYVVDERQGRAWGLSPDHLFEVGGRLSELLTNSDCAPRSQIGLKWERANRNVIIEEAYGAELLRMEREARKDNKYQLFFLSVLILVIGLVVLILVGLLQAGTLHF